MPAVPQFYVTPRQRLGTASILLAFLLAFALLAIVLYILTHSRHAHGIPFFGRNGFSTNSDDDDNNDDPNK